MIGKCRESKFQGLERSFVHRIAIALWIFAGCATAADWPQLFKDNSRNAVSAETNLPANFVPGTMHLDDTNFPPPKTTNLKWRKRLATHAYGGPVVANGKIFIGITNGRQGGLVEALDEAGGKSLWRLSIPKFVTKLPQYNFDNLDLGICSTPTVEGNRMYLVSNRDELLCLDTDGHRTDNTAKLLAETYEVEGSTQPPLSFETDAGGIEWSVRMLIASNIAAWVQDAASCSVIVDGDYIYVNPSNGVDKSHKNVPHPDTPTMVIVDKRTGKVIARDHEGVGHRLFHGEWSSPSMGVVNGKKLIFFGGGDGVCYAFDAAPVPPKEGEDCGTVACVWKFDIDKAGERFGAYRTVAGPSEAIAAPVFFSNRVYLAVGQDPRHKEGRGVLACIDATKTGDITESGKIWLNKEVDRSLTTVVIADGMLFTADFTGQIFCIDPDTGRTLWKYETHRPIWSSPLVADGKVYVGTDTGDFWCFAASKEMKILGKTKLDSAISASPIAVNGVLYVMTQKWLYAVAEGSDWKE